MREANGGEAWRSRAAERTARRDLATVPTRGLRIEQPNRDQSDRGAARFAGGFCVEGALSAASVVVLKRGA